VSGATSTSASTWCPSTWRSRADKSKFKQVLYNLLSNAIKFTPQGGKVWVSARADTRGPDRRRRRHRVGIPAEHHKRIFDEFYQLDHATTRQVEGTAWGCRSPGGSSSSTAGSISLESDPGPRLGVHVPVYL